LPGNIFCRFEIIGHQQKLKFENLALFSASLVEIRAKLKIDSKLGQ